MENGNVSEQQQGKEINSIFYENILPDQLTDNALKKLGFPNMFSPCIQPARDKKKCYFYL